MAALRRSRRLAQVLLWIKIELGFALGAAEVIRLPFVLGSSSGGSRFYVLWSKNSSSLPREGSLPDRRLMPLPAHSTSADHPVVPCNARFCYPRSPFDSARETAIGSACPGDCAPRGNVLRSRNSSSLPRKGSFPDRRLMPLPAHSTSADHPVVPCNAQFRYPRLPFDSATGTRAGSACPGDCAPRGNVPYIAAGLGAAASPRTR